MKTRKLLKCNRCVNSPVWPKQQVIKRGQHVRVSKCPHCGNSNPEHVGNCGFPNNA